MIRHGLFLTTLFATIWMIGCDTDQPSPCPVDSQSSFQSQFESADGPNKFDVIKQFFDYNVLDSSYIIYYLEDESSYQFYGENGSQLCVPHFYILHVQIDSTQREIEIQLSNLTAVSAPYLLPLTDLLISQFDHDPFQVNPLCGSWQIRTREPVRARITVFGKQATSQSLTHTFSGISYEHSLPILGLYENHVNTIVLSLLTKFNSLIYSDTLFVPILKLSTQTAQIEIITKNESLMTPGMNLVSARSHPGYDLPYMFDSEGELRWLLDFGQDSVLNRIFYDTGIERLANGNWYMGDIRSDKLYEIGILGNLIRSWDLAPYQFHHKVQEKSDGNFLVSVSKPNSTHQNGRLTLEDFVIEIDRESGMIIREWDLKNSLDEWRTDLTNKLNENRVDWLHVNALFHDASDNSIIISGRHQGVFKVSNDNRVKWILAPHRGWTTARNGDIMNDYLLFPVDQNDNAITDMNVIEGSSGHPQFEWCWGQHAVSKIGQDRLIVFDNGWRRNFDDNFLYSRVVEYTLDEINMTVKQTWDFGKSLGTSRYSAIASNVQYNEESDNYFFNAGFFVNNRAGNGGVMIEVDRTTKNTVFEAEVTPFSGFAFHRMHRYTLYPEN